MKKKIVIFTESMNIMGGMERVIEFISNSFITEFDITILTMDNISAPDFSLPCTIETLNINICPNNAWNKIKRYVKTIYKLNKYLKLHSDTDYFIANSPALCGCSAIVNLITPDNMKFILIEHNKFDLPNYFWKLIRRLTFPKCYKVIALSQDAHREYLKIKCPSVHIPNAITIPISNKSSLDQKKMVAVGRLSYQKGFDSLLQAWKIVCETNPDWRLEIVGEGEDRPLLEGLIESLSLSQNVNLYGKSCTIQNHYLSSSAFILSSRYEGFCLVMIEAMAHGLPCISFNCQSGPNEVIIDKQNGFLVENQNIKDLADKIKCYITLTENEKQKMGQFASITANNYLPEVILDQWKNKVFTDNY